MSKGQQQNSHSDFLFKIVLVGDSNVGKSCLLLRFADDNFNQSYISTIGVDFRFKTLNVDGKVVKLQIWDTAGQQRFKTITGAYYRGADGVMLVFDKTNPQSMDSIPQWVRQIQKYEQSDVKKILIGNKADLFEQSIDTKMGSTFAEQQGMAYIQTSALTAFQVTDAFELIVREMIDRKKAKRRNRGQKIDRGVVNPSLRCCYRQFD